jgi:hypothetical protein
MAAAANAFVRGCTEVGHYTSGPVDVPWGKTQQDGFQIQMNVTTVDLLSAQSKMVEDTGTPQIGMDIVINGIDGSLTNIGRVYGLPDAAFTGDLGTGTDEVLDFNQDEVGETERALYAEGPGPLGSVRRFTAERCKVVNVGALVFSSTSWMVPVGTWRILNPGTDPVAQFTDIAAS